MLSLGWGCSSLVEHRTTMLLTQVRFPSVARNFLTESTFSANCRTCVHTFLCAIAFTNICAHAKEPALLVRVRWIIETLKHPACTVGWVAQLCHSWLSPGKATQISLGRNPIRTIQLLKKKKSKVVNFVVCVGILSAVPSKL